MNLLPPADGCVMTELGHKDTQSFIFGASEIIFLTLTSARNHSLMR